MGEKPFRPVTRRETLALLGGAAFIGSTGVGTAVRASAERQPRTVRAFVGSYHWGYFVLDEAGEELDRLTLSTGDELRLTAFNVESDDAVAELPSPVQEGIPDSDERAQRNERAIPAPSGTNLEALHEAAEETYPDHSLAILADSYLVRTPGGRRGPWQGPDRGPWGSHHGPGHHGGFGGPSDAGPHGPWWGDDVTGMLTPPTYLWHHATTPAEVGFVVETSGSFGFVCTVYCGYGHPYMVQRGRLVVEGE